MSKVRLYGDTSGYVELAAPDVSDDGVLTLPTAAQGILAANGGIGSNAVQTVKTDTFVTTSTSFVDVTGLTVTVTPSSASSKILVIAQVSYAQAIGSGYGHFKLAGGNSGDYIGDNGTIGSRIRAVFGGGSVANNIDQLFSASIVYLDSPATAAPVTYSVSVRQSGSGSVIVNRSNNDINNAGTTRGASSITVIEVAA
jgi:hypothetical protein